MRETGSTTNSTVMASSSGPMEPGMRDNITKARSTIREILTGRMVLIIKVIFLTIISRDLEHTLGLMDVNTPVNGRATKCMVKVFSPGPTDAVMKVSTRTTKNMARACSFGLMAESTLAHGKMVNKTERASTQEVTAKAEPESGRKAGESNGTKIRTIDFVKYVMFFTQIW